MDDGHADGGMGSGASEGDAPDLARLKELLADADADTRGMAAVALAHVPGAEAAAMLAEMLRDADSRVVCAAERSLAERGEDASVPQLMRLVAAQDTEVRCGALSALAQIGDDRAFPPVVTALFDPDDAVRRNAAAALGRFGDARAIEPLIVALSDPYPWVRGNAVLSLARFGGASVLEALRERLSAEDDEAVRGDIYLAMAGLDAAFAPRLLEALCDVGEKRKARVSAATGLADMAVAGSLEDACAVRAAATALLASDGDEEVRASCAWLLGRLGMSEASTEALVAALSDAYRWTVLYAIESLALLKDPRATDALREFRTASAGDDELVSRAEDAIREIESGQGKAS